MKTKIKKRVTRFQPSITKRKAEVYFEGRSLDLNDARIKRALDYNEDLSNQFVVGTPSRYSSYPGGAEHSYQPEKRVKKPRKAQQKREKPMAEEGVAQIKDLQRVFGEVEDFELMKEVVPKEQYVLKERPNKRRQHTTTLKINNYDSFFDDTEPIDSDSPLAVVAEDKQKTPGKLFKCDGDTLKMALSATSSFQPQNENEQGKQQQQSSSSHVDDTFDSQSLLATVAEEPTSSGGRVLKSHGSLNTAKNLSACPFRASTSGWELREEEEEQWEESLNTAKSLSATSSFQPENEQGKQQQQSSSSHVVDSSDYQSLLETVAEEPTSAGGRVLKSHGNLNTAKSLSISACPLRASTAGWELREEEEEQWEESLNTAKSLSATSSFRPQNENEQSKQHQQSSSTQAVDSFDYQSLLATVAEEPTSSDGRVLKSHGSLNTAKSLSACLYRASAGWEIREEEEEQWEEKPAESPEYEYLKVLLDKCDEKRAINWEQFTMSFDNCVKLGEGTYGEVFKFCVGNEEAAIKIIPISATPQDCDRLVNGSSLQSPGIVSNELNITRKLSDLADETETCRLGFVTPTFIRLIRAAVVKGEYPKQLLDAWDDFKEEKSELCENQRPSEYATADQHFMLLALSNGGVDLEAYWIREPRESYSIFYQIALALAIAEDALEFEHRDLHIGNVLIDDQCSQDETIGYVYDNESIQINSCGVKVSIIDFTNSRMTINGGTFFMNLSEDECLFTGKGLPKGDYQFDIYRMMREENGNAWNTFTPKTNLLWLHYLSRKLFGIPRLFKKKVREPLLKMFDALLEHNRVKDFLESQPFEREFKEYKVQQRKQSESEEESLLEH